MAKAKMKSDSISNITPAMYDSILTPVVTEKSHMAAELNKFTFKVATWATKSQIKAAVEKLFETKVVKVNIINVKGKVKRFRGKIGKRKDEKKAIVTLAEGQSIDVAGTI
jgi:large subunit ribosomal protein L23